MAEVLTKPTQGSMQVKSNVRSKLTSFLPKKRRLQDERNRQTFKDIYERGELIRMVTVTDGWDSIVTIIERNMRLDEIVDAAKGRGDKTLMEVMEKVGYMQAVLDAIRRSIFDEINTAISNSKRAKETLENIS